MKEYVKESSLFFELTKGTRTHWAIRREPEVYTDMSGRDKIKSGYYRHIGSITGRSVDGHLILLEVNLGSKHPQGQDYQSFLQQIEEALKKEFPLATPGVWAE